MSMQKKIVASRNNNNIINSLFRCSHTSTGDAVDKLVDYFLTKIGNPRISESVSEMEDILQKGSKLLHHNHYVVTLIKIKVRKVLQKREINRRNIVVINVSNYHNIVCVQIFSSMDFTIDWHLECLMNKKRLMK